MGFWSRRSCGPRLDTTIEETGGAPGLRDAGGLESALMRPPRGPRRKRPHGGVCDRLDTTMASSRKRHQLRLWKAWPFVVRTNPFGPQRRNRGPGRQQLNTQAVLEKRSSMPSLNFADFIRAGNNLDILRGHNCVCMAALNAGLTYPVYVSTAGKPTTTSWAYLTPTRCGSRSWRVAFRFRWFG